jgi:hypothetical protein
MSIDFNWQNIKTVVVWLVGKSERQAAHFVIPAKAGIQKRE